MSIICVDNLQWQSMIDCIANKLRDGEQLKMSITMNWYRTGAVAIFATLGSTPALASIGMAHDLPEPGTLGMIAMGLTGVIRGGSVCLNNFRTADKWISAPVMPRPGLVAAR